MFIYRGEKVKPPVACEKLVLCKGFSVQPGIDAADSFLSNVEGSGLFANPASGTAADPWKDALSCETTGASK